MQISPNPKLELIEELPLIVKDGHREVAKILERIQSESKITLQTNEYVLPKVERGIENTTGRQEYNAKQWHNRLIYGDNLLVMQGLLLGDKDSGLESMRGKIDLIYIDPPYDSKADYRTKITLPNSDIEQKPNVLEQFAYSDTWRDGTISYLRMIYPRIALMRELLSERGSIYVHLDWHIEHYVKILMDKIFGKENFRNEIIWHYRRWTAPTNMQFQKMHDTLLYYGKNKENGIFNVIKEKLETPKKQNSNDGKGKSLRDEQGNVIYHIQQDRVIDDVWDLPILNPQAKERLDYATQKPEALLERIIKASSYGDSPDSSLRESEANEAIHKKGIDCHDFASAKSRNDTHPLAPSAREGEQNDSPHTHSPSLARGNSTHSPSLAEGARGWVKNEPSIVADFFAGSGTTLASQAV